MRSNGKLIRATRKSLGLLQQDVANMADVSRRSVQYAEAGQTAMTVQVLWAIADALQIRRSEVYLADSEQIDNEASFSIWPWRLYEFLKRRATPGEDCYVPNLKQAEAVVDEIWKTWCALTPEFNKNMRTQANMACMADISQRDFRDRYLSIWEANPMSFLCSSSGGVRTGVSVLLPVSDSVCEAFFGGELPVFAINGDHVLSESQCLIYDSVYEFDSASVSRWHSVVESIGFVSFYHIAMLAMAPADPSFRIATYGATERNIGRMKSIGTMQTDNFTPNFGHRIWGFSGDFNPKRYRYCAEQLERSATSTHYLSMLKRWAEISPAQRLRVKATIGALQSYQSLIVRPANKMKRAG